MKKYDWYILFKNHTEAMTLYRGLKEAKIAVRISPTPRQASVCCGVSLLIADEDMASVRQYLEKTGASTWVSQMLVGKLGGYSPYILLASIYFTTSLLTMFISNTATAILIAPIAMSAATGMGINPLPLLIAVSVGASMCFASPFSTPPNALVMSAGRYTFMDYVKVGLPLQILMGIVMVLALPLLFPF